MKTQRISERVWERIAEAITILLLTLIVLSLRSQSHSKVELWIEFSVTALIAAIVFFVFRSRHVQLLWNIEPRSSIVELVRLRGVAIPGQRLLADEYRHLRARFLMLLDNGHLPEATYREQMEFARVFYATHQQRFWATTLDPWSEFVRSNEAYGRIMAQRANSLPNISTANITDRDTPPQRARLFILPARRFVADVIKDPPAARELVKCHYRLWKTVPHLLLLDVATGACWSEMLAVTGCEYGADAVVIPDFMLVDDKFIYGRIAPEVLEDKTPMNRSSFTLGFCERAEDRGRYDHLFKSLWARSISIADFANLMLSGRGATIPRFADRSVNVASSAVTTYDKVDVDKLFDLLANAREDIADFLGEHERRDRYRDLLDGARNGKTLGELFIEEMQHATTPCYAIDQADLKDETRRFHATWREEHYTKWREAFACDGLSLRRRIYVVRDWNLADDPSLTALLMEEVCRNHVQVGLILKSDLARFAEATRGSDAAVHDAEWIIINADLQSGFPVAGGRTVGVSLGAREIRKDEAAHTDVKLEEQDLILKGKMDAYLKWHNTLWDDEDAKLFKLRDEEDVRKFEQMLRTVTSAA